MLAERRDDSARKIKAFSSLSSSSSSVSRWRNAVSSLFCCCESRFSLYHHDFPSEFSLFAISRPRRSLSRIIKEKTPPRNPFSAEWRSKTGKRDPLARILPVDSPRSSLPYALHKDKCRKGKKITYYARARPAAREIFKPFINILFILLLCWIQQRERERARAAKRAALGSHPLACGIRKIQRTRAIMYERIGP